jgi:O-acetyl-ADP-ribose deacetylase (regulator of RNase III)/uncharacterized protein YwgA
MTRPVVKVGNILASDSQTLVNTVNCVGIMGKGIALDFKKRFPEMFEDYVRRCDRREVKLGRPYLYSRMWEPWILNFPTKDHWRSVSRLSDITAGLVYLEEHVSEWGITSIAVPPLGCGNGQLEWRVVGPTLYRHLSALNIPVELYAPRGTPESELTTEFLGQHIEAVTANAHELPASKIKPAEVALVEIVARLNRARYGRPVGRTIVQKLAYFASVAGIPTDFTFGRASFGPFSSEVKPMVARLGNNGLLVEERRGRMLALRPGPTYGDGVEAYRDQLREWEPIIDRVVDLFLRVNTNEAEIAATILFAARDLESRGQERPFERAIFEAVKEWKQRRKPPLDDADVAEMIRHLHMLRWLNARMSSDLPVPDDALASA